MKTTMLKDFHDLKLRFDFYKILTPDRQLIDMIKLNCEKDHTNVDTLKLVSTDNIYSKTLDYNDSENFLKYLSFMKTRDIKQDMLTSQKWIVEFKFNSDVNFFKIIMDSQQAYRLFSQVSNYYNNYLSYSVMAKQQSALEEEKKPKQEKKVTEYINNPDPVVERPPVVSPHELITRERTELDNIFELCLSSSIKASLIHYTFSYFRFITDKHCSVRVSEQKQVQYILPLLLPGNFGIDQEYFSSLILSSLSIPTNNVTYAIKKILQNLLANPLKYKENTLYMMMINYLLFIYLLRYLHDSNKDSFRHNFRQFFCSHITQSSLIKRMIEIGFPDFVGKLFFKITNIDLASVDEEYNSEKISKISEQYKHLIPVSQKDFADKIFNEANMEDKREPIDFILSNKKVIDINSILINGQKQQRSSPSTLFDPDQTLDYSEEANRDYDLLNYKLQSTNGSKVITKAYQYLLNYVKNPSSVLLLNNNELPKEVINLFDVLVKKVLNVSKIAKDNVSTFNYYKILLDAIPNPNNFKHLTFLYIIFNIIIPYHFDIYSNPYFDDYFL